MAGLFELAALETRPRNLGVAPNTPAPPTPMGVAPQTPGPQTLLGAQPQGGLFSDPTALAMMGSYLMAAGAPSLDPGHFGRTIAQMAPAMAQYRQGQQQQQALNQYRQQQLEMQRRKLNQPLSGAPGTQFLDPNDPSKVLHSVPFKPAAAKRSTRKLALPGGMIQDQETTDNGQTWQNVGQPYMRRDPWKQVTRVTPDGGVEIGYIDTRTLPGGQQQTAEGEAVETPEGTAVVEQQTTEPTIVGIGEKAPTQDQRLAAGYVSRMQAANDVLADVEREGASMLGRFLEGIPGGNLAQDADYQRFAQARRDFINAVLRRESGAVISQSEFDNADQQYFPQPGDSSEVIEQKRKNRERVIRDMRRSAGAAVQEEPPAPATSQGWSIRRTD